MLAKLRTALCTFGSFLLKNCCTSNTVSAHPTQHPLNMYCTFSTFAAELNVKAQVPEAALEDLGCAALGLPCQLYPSIEFRAVIQSEAFVFFINRLASSFR